MKYCLIFSREIFYVAIALYLSILWQKAVNETTARKTWTRFTKFIKVCSIEYLTTQKELVLPTFKSSTVHKIVEYLTLGLLSSLEISITVQELAFLTRPVELTDTGTLDPVSDSWLYNNSALLCRIACSQCVDAAYCYSYIVVRVSVDHNHKLCKNGWINRDEVWTHRANGSRPFGFCIL